MSPIGGVGINLAMQDAVAAANQLAAPLRSGKATDADLQAIQHRRTLPVRVTQGLQLIVQKRIISQILAGQRRPKPPLVFKLFNLYPAHVRTRKSFGLMTRKLSVTDAQNSGQHLGTFLRRKSSVASANSRYVA